MPKKLPQAVKAVQNKKVIQDDNSRRISYSHLSIYEECPSKWYRTYITKEIPYQPSIYTVFGTSIHETIQNYLDVLYNDSVKAADEIDLSKYLHSGMLENY